MNDLTIKNVLFCGTELLAVQDKETGNIYAGINSVLRDLGFDERQIEYRRNKWSADKVIAKGVQKFSYPSENRGIQEAYCINIKKLPLALAKLDITPKMEKKMPELSSKLEEYQDKCADVLAEAFLAPKVTITYQYPVSPAAMDSATNAGRLFERIMRSEGAAPHEIAMAVKHIYEQVGIEIPQYVVKVPAYEQLSLDIVAR